MRNSRARSRARRNDRASRAAGWRRRRVAVAVGSMRCSRYEALAGSGGRAWLNSEAITEAIRPCNPQGTFGARHWHTRLTYARHRIRHGIRHTAGACWTGSLPVCRKRPFTTHADRLHPRLTGGRLPVAGPVARRPAGRGHRRGGQPLPQRRVRRLRRPPGHASRAALTRVRRATAPTAPGPPAARGSASGRFAAGASRWRRPYAPSPWPCCARACLPPTRPQPASPAASVPGSWPPGRD